MFDIGAEGCPIHGSRNVERSDDPVPAHPCNQSWAVPKLKRRATRNALPSKAPAAGAGHLCIGPCFINEDQFGHGVCQPGLALSSIRSCPFHMRLIALDGDEALFMCPSKAL